MTQAVQSDGPGLTLAGDTIDAMAFYLPSADLVGRTAELDELRSALERATEGQPVTVLLGGEAGVGKTRLVSEFAAEADAVGAQVVIGQCVELGGDGLAYAPIAGALRELLGLLGAEHFLDLAGPGADALASLLPELGLHDPADVEGRGRLFEVITVLLERASAQRPLVLVVEDLQWADGSTRDLLRFIVRAIRSAHLVVLATYRTDEIHRTHPLRAFLAELERVRNVQRLEVPRLTEAEVGEQLAGLLGHVPSAAAVARVHKHSEGIPFFVEELATAGVEGECIPIPQSLKELLLVRVERLTEPTQEVLRLLATGGTRVDHELLVAVTDLDPSDLDAALREAVSANALRVDGNGYAFRHALLRAAMHEDLLPGEHSRLHLRYAQAIEAQPVLITGGTWALQAAHHWSSARQFERAFRAYLEAAKTAASTYAFGEQQLVLERALELWDEVPTAAQIAGQDRIDLIAQAVTAAADAGEPERALGLVKSGLVTAKGAAPGADLGRERVANLLLLKSKLLNELGRPGALDVVHDALALVPAEPVALTRTRILQHLAAQLLMEARFEEAVAAGHQALAAARGVVESVDDVATDLGFVEATFRVNNVLGPALIALGRIEEGLAVLATARELARDVPRFLAGYHINASDVLHLLGRYAEAADVAIEGIDRARSIGLARSLGAMVVGNAAEPLLALGDWPRAAELIERGLELDPPLRHVWHLLRLQGWLRLWRGDVDGAAALLDELRGRLAKAAPGAQYTTPTSVFATEVLLARGDAVGAWREVSAALDLPGRMPGYDLPLLAAGARALGMFAANDSATGSTAVGVARLVAELDRIGDWGPASSWRAVVDAELAGAVGDDPGAWRDAGAAIEDGGLPVHLRAYAGFRLGRALAAAGDRPGATAALRTAAEESDRMGAGLIRGWIADLSRRARIPLLDRVTGTEDDGLRLTARERDVLRLVSDGRSNRQIGEALFISGKTASVHVSNILAKLGVSTRGEAAAIAHQVRLFDQDDRQPA